MAASKTCTKCGRSLPATVEYFYSNGANRRGLFAACKKCVLVQQRAYYRGNREKALEASRKRYAENRESILARCRRYYYAKHEKNLADRRRWRKQNPDYFKKNREANPERVRSKNANRRAKAQNAEGSFTQADIEAQRRRQKNRCYYCRSLLDESAHVDHVVPLALGGSNWPYNIVLACPDCNLRKNATHPMDFAGLLF